MTPPSSYGGAIPGHKHWSAISSIIVITITIKGPTQIWDPHHFCQYLKDYWKYTHKCWRRKEIPLLTILVPNHAQLIPTCA